MVTSAFATKYSQTPRRFDVNIKTKNRFLAGGARAFMVIAMIDDCYRTSRTRHLSGQI